MFFQYDQFFSQFLIVTFNNVVKKFAKMHERKLAFKGVSNSNFN